MSPANLLPARALVVLVGQVQMSLCTGPCEHNHSDHSARTAVPLDRLCKRALYELDALLLAEVLPPICVAVPIDVR